MNASYPSSSSQTFLYVLAACVMVTVGCGDSTSGRGVPVSGTITLNGEPLTGANITFLNDTFAGFGRTDEQGRFRLVQGARPGVNKVVISKLKDGVQPSTGDAESGMDAGQFEAAAMGGGSTTAALPKDLLPPEFSDPNRTQLTFDVPGDGASDVDFNI